MVVGNEVNGEERAGVCRYIDGGDAQCALLIDLPRYRSDSERPAGVS